MTIIGTSEQIAAYTASQYQSDTTIKPCYTGAIKLDTVGYKYGAMCVSEWLYAPDQNMYMSIPAHYFFHWYGTLPMTKIQTISAKQLERIPMHLRPVVKDAIKAYRQRENLADPVFVYLF